MRRPSVGGQLSAQLLVETEQLRNALPLHLRSSIPLQPPRATESFGSRVEGGRWFPGMTQPTYRYSRHVVAAPTELRKPAATPDRAAARAAAEERFAEEQARQRAAEEKRAADARATVELVAEAERAVAAEKAAAAAEAERVAAAQRAAEAERVAAAERAAAERLLAEQRAAEQAAAEEQLLAEAELLAEERLVAEEARLAEEQLLAEELLAEEARLAEEEAAREKAREDEKRAAKAEAVRRAYLAKCQAAAAAAAEEEDEAAEEEAPPPPPPKAPLRPKVTAWWHSNPRRGGSRPRSPREAQPNAPASRGAAAFRRLPVRPLRDDGTQRLRPHLRWPSRHLAAAAGGLPTLALWRVRGTHCNDGRRSRRQRRRHDRRSRVAEGVESRSGLRAEAMTTIN